MLYEAHDRATYIQNVKDELREGFANFSAESNLYFSKKTLRKLLRQVTKYAKYTGDKAVLCELLIYYCELLNESKMPFRKSQVLLNLYNRIIATIEKACTSLHEDLQADYFIQIEALKD